MVDNNEIALRLGEILDVVYYDENLYQLHEDFCDRIDELVELINNMKYSTTKDNILSILDEKSFLIFRLANGTHTIKLILL